MYSSPLHVAVCMALGFQFVAAAPTPTWGSFADWWKHRNDWDHEKVMKPAGLNIQVGPRPYYLVDNMDEGPLKEKLESCKEGPFKTSQWSISHRGAALQFPEHSREGYEAAIRMGAGIIECDVAFTSDRELVCRHSNCDLHYTTNILAHPDLAAKCSEPFVPANEETGEEATAKCCTSDITLAEYKTLCAEMEASVLDATNVTAPGYRGRIGTTPDWRTNLYSYQCAEIMSLKEMIAQVDSYGLNITAELKEPEVPMPFEGDYTQEDFAQQLVDTFREANFAPERVWLQSFVERDVFQWIDNDPDFGRQAVYLDERADLTDGPEGYEEAVASLPALAARGVRIVAPSIYQLITVDNATNTIAPSSYAVAAREAGLDIITWSFERSGPLQDGGGYYYGSVNELINNDGDQFTVLDVIAQQVKAIGVFSDWPGTQTYYANCFGLP